MKLKAKSPHPVQLWFDIFARWCSPSLVRRRGCVGWGHETLAQPTYSTGGQSVRLGTGRLGVGALKAGPSALLPVKMRLRKGYSSVLHPWVKFCRGLSLQQLL